MSTFIIYQTLFHQLTVTVRSLEDLNSRVGNVVKDPVAGNYRNNPDNEVNTHGRTLSRMIKSFNCVVLNNLTYGNKIFDGKFTFEKADRKSQNDICLTNLSGLKTIDSFTIHDIPFNFSDHKPISLCTNLNLT